MLNSLDELNSNEMQIFAGLFISEAEDLPKGDPQKLKLLRAAQRLLDLSSQRGAEYVPANKELPANGD
jgi:hypothetical protein